MNTHNHTLLSFLLVPLWLLSVGGGCNQNREATRTTTANVELIKATKQDWTAGIQGGGSGTEFTFMVRTPASGTVAFQQIAIGGSDLEPTLVRPGDPVSGTSVTPGTNDTLHLRLSVKREESAASAASAVIHYTLSDEAKELAVPSIEKIPSLPRP